MSSFASSLPADFLAGPACPTLRLSAPWDDETVVLVPAAQALLLRANGSVEELSTAEAHWLFEARATEDDRSVREFARRAELDAAPSDFLDNGALRRAIGTRIEDGQLVALRQVGAGISSEANTLLLALRSLSKKIGEFTGPHFRVGGRHYALIAGLDLGSVRNRDEYELASRNEAGRVLDDLARQPTTAPPLARLLAEARERLSQDWRPPLEPDGLVLLRRKVLARIVRPNDVPTVTPSQLVPREEKTWIEIELVDEDDEPYIGEVELTLADGRTVRATSNAKGLLRLDGIVAGKCQVTLPDWDASSWVQK